MARGRKPLATSVHKAQGTYINQPGRENKREPKAPTGAPKKPAVLKEHKHAAQKWDELTKILADLGVLHTTDGDLLEAYCITYSIYRQALAKTKKYGLAIAHQTAKGLIEIKRNPFEGALNKALDRMTRLLAELGLTPSSRSRIISTNDKPKEDDPLLRYLNDPTRN